MSSPAVPGQSQPAQRDAPYDSSTARAGRPPDVGALGEDQRNIIASHKRRQSGQQSEGKSSMNILQGEGDFEVEH